jgi:hypothetical protein
VVLPDGHQLRVDSRPKKNTFLAGAYVRDLDGNKLCFMEMKVG